MNIAVAIFGSIAGLSVVSILIKHPWTILVARRHNPPEVWSTDLFLETNMVITAGWAFLFALAAVLSAFVPLWLNLIFGASCFFLGRLSPRFGSWYSSKRLKAMGLVDPE